MQLSSNQRRALDVMGITIWRPVADSQGSDELPPSSVPAIDNGSEWSSLRDEVAGCVACALSTSRTQTVFGVGNTQADLMIIGEAPGAEEDRQGEPFVGRAGKLLDEMLAAVGHSRETVFIANILKCRPPGNRNPKANEAEACFTFLERQIHLVQPTLILVVGKVAAQNLLQSDAPVGALRGQVHQFGSDAIPIVVTYHPAYLLRAPHEKRKTWSDLQLAMQVQRA